MCEHQILEEMYYKDIMRKFVPGWLPHRDYSHLIKSVHYKGHNKGTLRFFVPNRFNGWNTYIKFLEWDEQVVDENITAVEAARLLFWGANLQLHCTCPAFIYWGYEYILTQDDAAIVPETRAPNIRNPFRKGYTCKHLKKVLPTLPFHLGDIAKAIKEDRSKL